MTQVIGGIQQMANETIAFVPNLLAAVVILVIGWIVGRLLGKGVAALLDRLGAATSAKVVSLSSSECGAWSVAMQSMVPSASPAFTASTSPAVLNGGFIFVLVL